MPGRLSALLLSVVALFGQWVALAAILVSGLWLRLRGIDQKDISSPDEACHALVARNLLRHPLKPTLVEHQWIPPDPAQWSGALENWSGSHLWLHKPILPLWQIALSYVAFGVNAFALRLPSAILATGAVFLTFLIGRALFDRTTGLVAAAFQTAGPVMERLVHGVLFSDHIEVSLLFWAELGIFFGVRLIQTGLTRHAVLAGIAFGLAYLSKYYLGLVVPAVVGLVWLLSVARVLGPSRLRFRHLLVMVGAGVATAAPWVLWCLVSYRELFIHEHVYALQHISQGKEGYAAPWDRLLFEYLPTMWGNLFVPVVVAASMAFFTSLRGNRVGLAIVLGWLAIVLVPHFLATSKTPTATVVGIPAACLLVGAMIAAATRLDAVAAIAVISGTMAGSVFSERLGQIAGSTIGWHSRTGPSASGRFAGVLFDNPWLLPQLLWAAAGLGGLLLVRWTYRWIADGDWLFFSRICCAVLALVALAGAADVCRRGWLDSMTVSAAKEPPDPLTAISKWAAVELPHNAALFSDQPGFQTLRAQFWSDRTCYFAEEPYLRGHVELVRRSGGIPFLVTRQSNPPLFRSLRYTDPVTGWKVYELSGR